MRENITGHTTLTALLGSPVAHSISPMMHNEAFLQLGLDYAYLAFDVDLEHLKDAVDGLKVLNCRGFNCTMPHKTLICEYVDHLSQAASLIGAVNTVVNDNGILTGHNTDGIGYMQSVSSAGFDIIGEEMTLLGTGGAATAIAVQAALDGVKKLNIFNRRGASFDRARTLVDSLNKQTNCQVALYDIADITSLTTSLKNSRILTNATSVGMAPNTEQSIITDKSLFHPDLIVSDIIYNPEETLLLRLAKEAGCDTFNGLYMLLYQGAEAFRIWTGKDMPVSLIKEKYFDR
ncbi:MAG: shikimate dehydrogenase [Lachnospiraceae bacterium]|nr:shikimate dehydrogenase [Lachnospiraceae bacterium]